MHLCHAGFRLSDRGFAVKLRPREAHPKKLLSSQTLNPLLQSCLVGWVNLGEGNSHPAFWLGENHLAGCGEGCNATHDPQRDTGSRREGISCNYIASKQAQIAGERGDELLGVQINDFTFRCEGITGSAMETRMNCRNPRRLKF